MIINKLAFLFALVCFCCKANDTEEHNLSEVEQTTTTHLSQEESNQNKVYPPKHWWKEPATFVDAETSMIKLHTMMEYMSWNSECTRWVKSSESTERIQRRDCVEYAVRAQEERKAKYEEIYQQYRENLPQEWLLFKEKFKDGDQLLYYSAPPLSGGFGLFILREDKVIAYYESGVQ